MTSNDSMLKHLAAILPDIPRWVELRSMLLTNRCEVQSLNQTGELSFVARDMENGLIVVVGHPPAEAIQEVARQSNDAEFVTPLESREYVAAILPEWKAEKATLYLLKDASKLPVTPGAAVRLISPTEVDSLAHLPSELKAELVVASRSSPIAATFADQLPVSFSYAGSRTESLWDISIDTLAEYRNQGLAASCVAFLIDHFRAQGLQPVWGAVESNMASMRLAAKLGFVPVDEIIVFEQE